MHLPPADCSSPAARPVAARQWHRGSAGKNACPAVCAGPVQSSADVTAARHRTGYGQPVAPAPVAVLRHATSLHGSRTGQAVHQAATRDRHVGTKVGAASCTPDSSAQHYLKPAPVKRSARHARFAGIDSPAMANQHKEHILCPGQPGPAIFHKNGDRPQDNRSMHHQPDISATVPDSRQDSRPIPFTVLNNKASTHEPFFCH